MSAVHHETDSYIRCAHVPTAKRETGRNQRRQTLAVSHERRIGGDDRGGAAPLAARAKAQEGRENERCGFFQKSLGQGAAKIPSVVAVPLGRSHMALLIGLGLSTALGQGKLDQLFAEIFFLSLAVWAISDSHIFGLAVDLAACLDAVEETVDALQTEIVSLKSEVANLRAKAGDD
jgi:hypothetical protein